MSGVRSPAPRRQNACNERKPARRQGQRGRATYSNTQINKNLLGLQHSHTNIGLECAVLCNLINTHTHTYTGFRNKYD